MLGDSWIPWAKHARNEQLVGADRRIVAMNFVTLCQNGHGVFENGQWHVYSYEGIEFNRGIRSSVGHTTTQSVDVRSRQQLDDLPKMSNGVTQKFLGS